MEYYLYHCSVITFGYEINTHRIIHEFEKILLKLIAGARALHSVELDVRCEPSLLLERNDSVDIRQLQSWNELWFYKNIECMSYHSCHENIHIRFFL